MSRLSHKSVRSYSEPSTKTLKDFYYDDKQIYHFLQKDEVYSHRIVQKHMKSESHSVLKKINSLFSLNDNSSFQKIKSDNSKFLIEFTKAKNQQQLKPFEESFKYLIKEYSNKGYKIPKLSSNNNIFKENPLTELNKEKLENIFLCGRNSKTRNVFKRNILTYLRKIREIVMEQMQYYKKKHSFQNNFLYKPHHSIIHTESSVKYSNQDTISESKEMQNEKLLSEISQLITMIDECIVDQIDSLFNTNNKKEKKTNYNIFNCSNTKRYNVQYNNYKHNKGERRQSRNILIKTNPHIKQLKKQTFDFMNLKSFTSRTNSNIDPNNKTLDIQNKKPFFIYTPYKIQSPSSFSSFLTPNKYNSPKHKKQYNLLSYSSKSKKGEMLLHYKKSPCGSIETFNETSSTCFNTKRAFHCGMRWKMKSELIGYAYKKCKEKDYKEVKRALRSLLEGYKGMNKEEVDGCFGDVEENTDMNVVAKEIGKIKRIVNKSNIEEKVNQMFSGSEEQIEMIKPKLEMLIKESKEINELDKKFVRSIIKKQ